MGYKFSSLADVEAAMDTLGGIVSGAGVIQGAVDTFALLPNPVSLKDGTIYIVRLDTPGHDNGFYVVQSAAWNFFDALNFQDSDEVPNKSIIPGADVTSALNHLGGYFMSDFATPQDAIDAAVAAGKKFVFVDDVFVLTAKLTISADDFELQGLGWDTGFILNNASENRAIEVTGNRVRLLDFMIQGVDAAYSAFLVYFNAGGACTARGLRLKVETGENMIGVRTSGNDHRIEACLFDGCLNGVNTAAGDRTQVVGCRSYNSVGRAFQLGGTDGIFHSNLVMASGRESLAIGGVDRWSVKGNVCVTGAANYPLMDISAHNSVIEGNILFDNDNGTDSRGIYCHGGKNSVYKGNTIKLVGGDGIRVSSGDGITVEGNTFETCGQHGVNVTDTPRVKVRGNKVEDINANGYHGISIETCADADVKGNTVYDVAGDSSVGISVSASAGASCKQNRVRTLTGTAAHGIVLDGCTKGKCHDNDVDGVTGDGIRFDGTATDMTCFINTVFNSGSLANLRVANGITDSTFTSNHCRTASGGSIVKGNGTNNQWNLNRS